VQGRIHIEKINEPFLFKDKGAPAEHGAGMKMAIEHGRLVMHEFGTFVSLTPSRGNIAPASGQADCTAHCSDDAR
jgi:hypothetical protein